MAAKQAMVVDGLARAGIEIDVKTGSGTRGRAKTVESIDAGEPRLGYRNRMRLQVRDGHADFFNQAKRDGCAVVRQDLWKAIGELRATSKATPALLSGVRHVEVRVGDGQGKVGLSLSDQISTGSAEQLRSRLGPAWLVAQPGESEPATLAYRVANVAGYPVMVDVPVTSFVQVNSEVNRSLVAEVLAVAAGAATFIDAFSGAGNFSVPLLAQGLTGTAVDNAGDAVAALAAANLAGLTCIEGDARELGGLGLTPADLVILDPPRAGLGERHAIYQAVAEVTASTVVLIACNVDSFATDVAGLVNTGLSLDRVATFDMFPGTHHIETLAVLRR